MSARAGLDSAPRRGVQGRGNAADDFRLMADCAPVMIWVSGPDRKCAYVNRPWLEFTGRSLEEALDHGWCEGIHPDDRDRVLDAYARAFTAIEPFELEYRLRRRDGCFRWLLDKGVPVVVDGELNEFIGSCLDITDRMLAEKAAAELLERERMARAAAESATLARDQFLAIVSHELRSPLNGIKSWTHVLQGRLREADPTVARALNGIMIGVEQQVRLIEGLLDVTRGARGADHRAVQRRARDEDPGARAAVTSSPPPKQEAAMGKRNDAQPDIDEGGDGSEERPHRVPDPDPDTLEGPGGRNEAKGEENARNKTTRRGER